MKKRIQDGNTTNQTIRTNSTRDVRPTFEEIRHRAHEIFVARGGKPGNDLDDWLRAEQNLKQERAGTNTNRP